MATSVKTHDLTTDEFDMHTTERGLLVTVHREKGTYITYIPQTRDVDVAVYGNTNVIRVGKVMAFRVSLDQWTEIGKPIITAALGAGWEK